MVKGLDGPALFVPGTFSGVGRKTDAQNAGLRKDAQVEPSSPVRAKRSGLTGQKEKGKEKKAKAEKPEPAKEEEVKLAAAAQERSRLLTALTQKRQEQGKLEEESTLAKAGIKEKKVITDAERPSAAFAAGEINQDAIYAGRLPASMCPGALNRLKTEERPDPCWYRAKMESVKDRIPVADLKGKDGRPRHPIRQKPGDIVDSGDEGTFLTGVGHESARSSKRPRSQETALALPRSASEGALGKKFGTKTLFAAATGRGDLGKVSRHHVVMNDHSCPSQDMNTQDIKGYPKQRYPEWDFGRPAGRQPLIKTDNSCPAMHNPVKYTVKYDLVNGKMKEPIKFDRQHRPEWWQREGNCEVKESCIPDAKRAPGGVLQDYSLGKDALRSRRSVNNFNTELGRPPAKFGGELFYHDEKDPIASAKSLHNELAFDADKACIPVRARKDFKTPNFGIRAERMWTDTVGPRDPFIEPEGCRESLVRADPLPFQVYVPTTAAYWKPDAGSLVRGSDTVPPSLGQKPSAEEMRFLRQDTHQQGFAPSKAKFGHKGSKAASPSRPRPAVSFTVAEAQAE